MTTRHLTAALLSFFSIGTGLAQVPVVAAVVNNYSFTRAGLPNYGIAQGSIFSIFGSNLANTSSPQQAAPLQTNLSGVSVSITVNGTTKAALLYYVTPNQIGGVLPSSVPVGTGQITVTNNGSSSAPAAVVVVQSAFGLLTLNNGTGPAAAFDAKGNSLVASNAVNPGEAIVLWGTGAGPVPDDNQQSAVATPLEVDIGGIPAKVIYQGRSQFPGLDQLNVVVPGGLSGCYVSVVVRSGNYVSNFSSIPITGSGRVCSDVTLGLGFSGSQLQSLAGKTSFTTGVVNLTRINISTPATLVNGITILPASSQTTEAAGAAFTRITLSQPLDPYVAVATSNAVTSVGSCTMYTFANNSATTPPTSPNPPANVVPIESTAVNLNAGPFMNLAGPNGTKTLALANGIYSAQLGSGSGPAWISSGTYTFDNGSGGSDIGPFSTKLSFTPVEFSNTSSLATITRSEGATVTWTGGDSSTYVGISGSSSVANGTQFIFGVFNCTASASAHQFTIPAAVLLALPPSGNLTAGAVSVPIRGSLSLNSFALGTELTIPGVDLAYSYAFSFTSSSALYK